MVDVVDDAKCSNMPIPLLQTTSAMEVINIVLSATGPKKRQLAGMFLELVDRTDWPQYYEVIPEPRCLNNIKVGVEKGRYKDALDIYTDLSLVFWNALFYNEPTSQIALDAKALKDILEAEWKKRSILAVPRASPPPSSAQKVHKAQIDGTYNKPTATPQPPANIIHLPPSLALAVAPTAQTVPPLATASTSKVIKPVAIRPKSAHLSEETMTPEPDIEGDGKWDIERDEESEEIVRELEKGLPRWPGFGEEGWLEGVRQERIIEVIHTIKTYKDVNGNRLATALEAVSEEATTPYLSYTSALSLKIVEDRARSKTYNDSKESDMDMARLFEKGRRWHKPGSDSYGHVLTLQRLYQSLMSSNPPPGPPYHTTTNFAALRAGPGNVKPVHGSDGEGVPNVTTHRVLSKDRAFVDELHYKGWSLKLADWVHLSNPDDPSRPIIGQIFRCWISDEIGKTGQPGVTVSWYYRPEQTFHSANRMFWEGEVFKTSHFADHPLEDVIEKIACQFTARHIRGRPRPPFWYLGFPLYVCDSRYNDRERVFVKIKNWNSCVPEEVRKSTEFMPIYPFERTVFPPRLPSPFVGKGALKGSVAGKGPGGLVAGEPADQASVDIQSVGAINGQRRTRQNGGPTNLAGKSYAGGLSAHSAELAAAITQFAYQPPNAARSSGPDRSVITAAGGHGALGQDPRVEKLPAETAKHFDRDAETNEVLWFPAPPVNMARSSKPKYSMAYLHFLARKRKRELKEDATDMDGGSGGHPSKKCNHAYVPSTVTETLRVVLKESLGAS